MTPDQLAAVIARTRHERFRELTREDNPDVAQRDGYRDLVRRLADGPAHVSVPSLVPTPLSESLRARKLGGRNCPHGSAARCGCSGLAACSLMRRDVSLADCAACLATGPRSHEVTP